MNRHKAIVAWDEVYMPKDERGFGLMKNNKWNVMAMMRHVWNLIRDVNHFLWVNCVWENRLKIRNIWEVKANMDNS